MKNVKIIFLFLCFIWTIYLINFFLLNGFLNQFGIVPRDLQGLIGVALSPFLHSSLAHLWSNTIPFLVLGLFLSFLVREDFFQILISMILLSGFSTWLLADLFTSNIAVHIGLSSIIFGEFAFILSFGIYRRSFFSLFCSLFIIIFYGLSILIGLVPMKEGVSYSGHWFGFFSGLLISYFYIKSLNTNE